MRRLLTVTDRAGIARGLAEGCGLREIARRIGRDVSVVSREVARNQGETGYKCVAADVLRSGGVPGPSSARLMLIWC